MCAAAMRPRTYARLLLIDPTIYPEASYGTAPVDASYIAKRKNIFRSAEEMIERYRGRLPFSRWHPQVLRDYCEFGILPRDGEFVLACPPDIEASIYHQAKQPAANLYPEIARIEMPVAVIRAGTARTPGVFDLNTSPTAVDLASHFRHGSDKVYEECSHYIPQEAPTRVAEEIARLL